MSRAGSTAQSSQPPRDAPKLLSLLNSTLSSSHELVRSLALVSQPSTSLTRPIKRNLATLAAGIADLQKEQVMLEQEGRRSKVSLEEIRRKEDELIEVKGAWDRLCEVLDKHEKTSELLNDVRQSHAALFQSVQTNAQTLDSLSPYRDNPHRNGAQGNADRYDDDAEEGPDNAAIIQSQNQEMASQDRQLDALSLSIGRQHHLSLQMNEELDTHANLLDEMDRDVENTGARLGRASRRLDQFSASLKEHGSTWTIFALIVILVLLIAIFK